MQFGHLEKVEYVRSLKTPFRSLLVEQNVVEVGLFLHTFANIVASIEFRYKAFFAAKVMSERCSMYSEGDLLVKLHICDSP